MQMLNELSPPSIDCTSIVLYKAFMYLTPKAIISAHFYSIFLPPLNTTARVGFVATINKSVLIKKTLICNVNSLLYNNVPGPIYSK